MMLNFETNGRFVVFSYKFQLKTENRECVNKNVIEMYS